MKWPTDPFNQFLAIMAVGSASYTVFLIGLNLLMNRAIERASRRARQQTAERPSRAAQEEVTNGNKLEIELYPDLANERVVFKAYDPGGEFTLRMDADAAREFADLLRWAADVIDPEGEEADGGEVESAAVQTPAEGGVG